jgi:hypothetical protein
VGAGGTIYVFAGGAPLYVSDWNHLGGPKPYTTIDSAAIDNAGSGGSWSHVRVTPADGTIVRASGTPTAGAVYVFAGGAPIYVVDWAHVGGSRAYTTVDGTALDNAGAGGAWNHVRATPADGTAVYAVNAGVSALYVFAGGAPLHVANWTQACADRPATFVDTAALDNAGIGGIWNHVRYRPADGTFIRDGQSDDAYRVVGGAPIYVSSWSVFGGAPPPAVDVDGSAIAAAGSGGPYNHLLFYPADGTLVTGARGGARYTVTGGVPAPYTGTATIPATNTIDQYAIDHASESAQLSHLRGQ